MPRDGLSSEELRAFYLPAINKYLPENDRNPKENGSKPEPQNLTGLQSGLLSIQLFSSSPIGSNSGSKSYDIGQNPPANQSTPSHLRKLLENSASSPKNHAGMSILEHSFQENFYDGPEQQGDLSWEDTLKINPYQNLDPRESLLGRNKRPRRPRRSRLTKAPPQQLTLSCDTSELLKSEETRLLGSPQLIHYELEFVTPSRTPSPAPPPSAVISSKPSASRPNSSCSSTYLNSITYFESKTSTSSHRSTIQTTPPTTRESITQASEDMETPWDYAPRPFQCTFCLHQCDDFDDWEHHEFSVHIPKKVWVCMPWGPVEEIDDRDFCVFCGLENPREEHDIVHAVDACYCKEKPEQVFATEDALFHHLLEVHNQVEETSVMAGWSRPFEGNDCYWNCGFCDEMMSSWTARAEHIGRHFENGMVMSFWDPLVPSYPLDRSTLHCITGFPPPDWDAKTLWDLERSRVGFSWVPQPYRCQYCDVDVCFREKAEVDRHEFIWHTRREVWTCPTIRDIQKSFLATHFFPEDPQANSWDENTCCFCRKDFHDQVHSLSRGRIWDLRLAHLEEHHEFGACQPAFKSTRAGDLLFHLANIHRISLNVMMTADVLESCRKEESSIAKRLTKYISATSHDDPGS
ncbi:hypothetical protein BGZ60DRAFT_553274 [Tricladium varicosporioides]|nr:hypothetical protein BGZ60DRAFT_553274 [Hymenoscyphus varicosporioides]